LYSQQADPAGTVRAAVSMSLADVLKASVAAGLWCRAADTMRMCHWLAMDTIL
jgi:hypothetical protein